MILYTKKKIRWEVREQSNVRGSVMVMRKRREESRRK